MTKGKFETVLMKFIPESSKEWTGAHFVLLTAAEGIDRTREQLVRDAEYLARKFSEFAVDVARPASYVSTPPTNSSTVHDITANARALQVAQDSFYVLVNTILGPVATAEFVKNLCE